MNTMGINMGIKNPNRFSSERLHETVPKINTPAKKPMEMACHILDFFSSFFLIRSSSSDSLLKSCLFIAALFQNHYIQLQSNSCCLVKGTIIKHSFPKERLKAGILCGNAIVLIIPVITVLSSEPKDHGKTVIMGKRLFSPFNSSTVMRY